MDVVYYWKRMEEDLKKGLVGAFRADKQKLETLKAGYPSFIWIFKSPPKRTADVQLVAKLTWTDAAPKGFTTNLGESVIYYDAEFPRSGRFNQTLSEAGIEQTTNWMREHFPAAVRAKFVGQNGQQELRGEPLRQLQKIAETWPLEPLV